MTEEEIEQIKSEVLAKVGDSVGMVWGPCTVVGLEKDEEGNNIISMREDDEHFTIDLADWKTLK